MAVRILIALSLLQLAAADPRPAVASSTIVRSESKLTQGDIVRVGIDQHSHLQKHEPEQVSLTEEEAADMKDMTNPCSYLGCNSHKCAWASGGAITRLVAKKACSNALTVGSQAPALTQASLTATGQAPTEATPATDATAAAAATAANLNTGALASATIVTLRDCLHAVIGQTTQCSGSFQMHKDTNECSCVPAGAQCLETENENMCRFQILEQR